MRKNVTLILPWWFPPLLAGPGECTWDVLSTAQWRGHHHDLRGFFLQWNNGASGCGEAWNSSWLCGDVVGAKLTLTPRTGVHRLCGHDWVFNQDNAAVHNAHLTKDLFQRNVIILLNHPACFADLNPFENTLRRMAREVYKNGHQFQTIDPWSHLHHF